MTEQELASLTEMAPTTSIEAGWKEQAIARCYFHSPMPTLVRALRERYRLAISSTGSWPRVSFVKRNEPTARILIYHRVNDENDPFLPAISTALFEREMRFLQRQYRVVPLGELVQTLGGGEPDSVVAITFDDGYQDNYLNAFPILERYGLPATIFLTTGGIDTGEPLWFAQLAQALKLTSRDFVDLDLDEAHPRFWLRTPDQRLAANARIFSVLRTLPDAERRQWMTRILQVLSLPKDSALHRRMLTWDQVRLMQKRGIEFGGHTVTHPFLSRLPREKMLWELSECKRRIEEELQARVAHFAYPNGREEDFGRQNTDLVREAGYEAAVTSIWGVNYHSTDPMELRRGGPWEDSAAMFAYKLDWYQLVND